MRRRLLALAAVIVTAQVLVACSVFQGAPAPTESPVSVQPSGPIEGTVPVAAQGLNVPWAVGGERFERDGSRTSFQGEWPTVPFRALRLWDTRTAWLNLEPAPDQWEFAQLDSLVQKAADNGITDVTLVLGGTPTWAASAIAATDAPWMGPGSASMPADIEDWREYVDTVVRRYAGRITSYEIGNEPNLLTFWSGTPDQYRQFVATAAATIRGADPNATVVVNAGLVRTRFDVSALSTWMAPLQGSGDIDAVSVHFYPQAARVADATVVLKDMKRELTAAGWGDVPTWITEVNVRYGSALEPAEQQTAVSSLAAQVAATGYERAYWYAWTDLASLDLIQFQPETAGAAALAELP